jgi:hypothetical protein
VGDDVSVNSETLLVIDFMNFKIMSNQSFKYTHKYRMCVHIFIEISAYTYMMIYICTEFFKKKPRFTWSLALHERHLSRSSLCCGFDLRTSSCRCITVCLLLLSRIGSTSASVLTTGKMSFVSHSESVFAT